MAKLIVDEEMRFSIIIYGNGEQKELHKLTKETNELIKANKSSRSSIHRLEGHNATNTEENKRASTSLK